MMQCHPSSPPERLSHIRQNVKSAVDTSFTDHSINGFRGLSKSNPNRRGFSPMTAAETM
jgi:hypothetical protein